MLVGKVRFSETATVKADCEGPSAVQVELLLKAALWTAQWTFAAAAALQLTADRPAGVDFKNRTQGSFVRKLSPRSHCPSICWLCLSGSLADPQQVSQLPVESGR